ncbi:MAG: DUF1848 domain-containing protein [Clostridia bacterium]|nr:DUF1848 domain-containing protein [Clostridia bacterium]
MIISVSRRTDIPAFYSTWFLNRINEGFVLVRNPMNYHQVSKIQLTPDVVDCFVFWTKNPGRMIPHLDKLKRYQFYFQITITPYGSDIERNVPKRDQVIDSFRRLSEKIGKEKVIFRYDPILLTNELTFKYHLLQFEYISQKLAGYTDLCIISFIDDYMKIRKNMKALNQIEIDEKTMFELSRELVKTASKYRINLKTCSEKIDLSSIGIEHASCIDDKLISTIIGQAIHVEKDKNQRESCGCVTSIDIGSYNTCEHGCIYCYANDSEETIVKKINKHDVDSPFLIGNLEPEDRVTERKMDSLIEAQLSFIKKDSL